MAESDRGEAAGVGDGKPEGKPGHPGGSGAALGVRLARFSGWQGGSLLATNLLHYSSIAVVARFLGPSPLGAYALLFFLTGVITQIIHLITKPGTIRRTFGGGDEEDDIEEDDDEARPDEDVSDRPTYTLGVGIVWCLLLAAVTIAVVFAFRTPISRFLLGDPGQADAVVFATITGAIWATFKLGEMVLWFEGRPLAYVLVDASRPAFNLIAIVAILASGAGVKGAVIGMTVGTTAATLLCLVCLRGSFQFGFDFRELWEILKRGAIRIPIASSMWVVQNADVFLLSRFVDNGKLGLYNLASRTGFMVQFLPQGFRMALRPLRKTAVYTAYKQQYGTAVAQGQLLAYFVLLSLTAILAMVLLGEILIQIGGDKFESAAPLIPLTAGAMTMPALYRSIGQMAAYPKKKLTFVFATVFAALAYIGLTILLVSKPSIGIYGAPIALIVAFAFPSTYMFVRSQTGRKPMQFPYLAIGQAIVVATVIAVGYHLFHPADKWLQLPLIALLMGVWIASLFVLRIVPRYHWHPIAHIARSFLSGSAIQFDPQAGLSALEPHDRSALRTAVLEGLPAEALGGESDGASEGARLVRLLRQAGARGGVPVAERTELDAGISLFLFSDEAVAVRMAKMRSLLVAGADAEDLHTLEDLRDGLAKASPEAWGGKPAGDGSRRRARIRTRSA